MNPLALELRQYVKALIGGLFAALALLGGALGDGLSAQEWIGLAVAFLGGFAGVFYAPNRSAGPQSDPDLSEQDAGHGQVDTLTVVLAVAVLVILLVLVL